MDHVVLVIHLMLALAIISLVLLQRSEGGGLGIGQSGGLGGLATPGGTASILTKATGFCAACFFVTSLILGILAGTHGNSESLLDRVDSEVPAMEKVVDEGTLGEMPAVPLEKPKQPEVPVE